MYRTSFTSESVTEGHPDKMCDQISDAILDEILAGDKNARVACEVLATTGIVFVAGEITADTYADIESIVRRTVRDIGYTSSDMGFDANTCSVVVSLTEQSSDIAIGVDKSLELKSGDKSLADSTGAGDQGMMFGYANRDTDELMPMPIYLAHKLTRKLTEIRKNGSLPYLRPDGKSQVTVQYRDGKPHRVSCVVVSSQHSDSVTHDVIERDIIEKVIKTCIPENLRDDGTRYLVNPTGRFVIGGPKGDCGLTGRKIIVDTYGGWAAHGGGCFSGKDPTKVDRSATYMARYVAKNVVASGLADECQIEVAYAIGVAEPVSLAVNSFGTGKLPDIEIAEIIKKHFDMRPAAIINKLGLRAPIYKQTAAYGHFGRNDLSLPWEKTDMADVLAKELR